MSFFDNLLAGAAGGLGQGMNDYAAINERERREEEARQEKAALSLQLQQQRSDDARYKMDQTREMREGLAAMRGESGGKGAQGVNLMQMAIDAAKAGDPAAQDLVVRLTRTYQGKDAAANLSDNLYGRPLQESVTTGPTTGDLARLDRGQTDDAPVTQTAARNVSYDAQKGAQDLQRLYALALDPGKVDDQAKGERQWAQNDFGAAAARQVGKQTGGDREAMGETFGTLSNPQLNTSGQDLRQQSIDATNRRTDATLSNSDFNRKSREKIADINAALKSVQLAQAALKNARSSTRPQAEKDLADAKARYLAVSGGDATGEPSADISTPIAYPYTPRTPADAAAAYRKGVR